MARPSEVAGAILHTLERLFKLDNVTRIASVELWVLLTTLLLVVRFLIDFEGPWFGNPRRTFVVLTLEILNQNMVIYTMGLMQLSGARKVNDYFQVWAVLLVTLQYSVKIGRPYTRSKQVPLLDLMSSFWSANLLRVQTFYLLRFPLWTIWSLNAVRIIVLFVSSGKGETNNQESMRLVSDYMIDEHELPRSSTSTRTSTNTLDEQEQQKKSSGMAIRWHEYKYLVYGEHRVLKQVQDGSKRKGKRTLSSCFRKQVQSESSSSSTYKIQLDPDDVHKEQLVTINTIWKDDNGSGLLGVGEAAEHRRDLCLSFALYKLLRRRFYDLPMHEMDRPAAKEKMRRLVLNYILKNSEGAFRITGAELSFLQDLFYSKHATVFSGGLWVPLRSLLLSLCLATATGYIAYPARYIPERMDPADRNRITHGVFITRLMVGIIVLKEMLEIVLYLWSRWAKVLLLCWYAQLQHRHPVVEKAMRWFVLCFRAFPSCMLSCFCFCFCCKAKQTTVRQQNLLVTVRVLSPGHIVPRMRRRRGQILGTAILEDYTKDEILLKQLRRCLDSKKGISIHNYFSNAFGSSNTGGKKVKWPWPCNLKPVDTHIILVWHIATSICEIICSFNKIRKLKAVRHPQPFLRRHRTNGPSAEARPAQQHDDDDGSTESAWYEHYSTAVTLSNYCVYLVSKALVPDNGLVARKVLDEVIQEIDYVVIDGKRQPREKILEGITMEKVCICLMKTVYKPGKNPDHHQSGGLGDVEAPAIPPDDHHQVEEEEDDDDNNEEEAAAATPPEEEEDDDVEAAATPPDDRHQVEEEEDDDDNNKEEEEGGGDLDIGWFLTKMDAELANQKEEADDGDLDIECSLTKIGAELAKQLMTVYHRKQDLWSDLANFWTGFLLHLAANTGAATHGRHLAGDSELITHLWALLTHAGYRGSAVHGEEGLDEDIPDINEAAAKA